MPNTDKSDYPFVVNLRASSFDVRIDRQTPWGNPFVIGRDGDRAEVIEKYRSWVQNSDSQAASWIRQHAHELAGKRLGCWCAPKPCHGDVLAEMAVANPPCPRCRLPLDDDGRCGDPLALCMYGHESDGTNNERSDADG